MTTHPRTHGPSELSPNVATFTPQENGRPGSEHYVESYGAPPPPDLPQQSSPPHFHSTALGLNLCEYNLSVKETISTDKLFQKTKNDEGEEIISTQQQWQYHCLNGGGGSPSIGSDLDGASLDGGGGGLGCDSGGGSLDGGLGGDLGGASLDGGGGSPSLGGDLGGASLDGGGGSPSLGGDLGCASLDGGGGSPMRGLGGDLGGASLDGGGGSPMSGLGGDLGGASLGGGIHLKNSY
ncbi:glycine-rich protein 23-like [Mizuhopecten yessoensis]|uniref:glycine-rich protein 23-like n=1 Tax=Mizuhopecten yessoensis TaxID=6573 RepID=UPI000B4599EC|nr:glycine-rich protein 23-like [Mizuhopecten yessoensis]